MGGERIVFVIRWKIRALEFISSPSAPLDQPKPRTGNNTAKWMFKDTDR